MKPAQSKLKSAKPLVVRATETYAAVSVLFFLESGTSACASACSSIALFSATPFSSCSFFRNAFFSSAERSGSRGFSTS